MSDQTERPKDDYSLEVAPKDMTSYASMGLASEKWARTERSWVNALVIFFGAVLCLAVTMICLAWNYGWDNLLINLGWK